MAKTGRPPKGVSKVAMAFKPELDVEAALKDLKQSYNVDYSTVVNIALKKYLPEIVQEQMVKQKAAQAKLTELLKKFK